MFTSWMMRVSMTGMSLASLVMGLQDPRRGPGAETPQAGGGSAGVRVPWKWGCAAGTDPSDDMAISFAD